MAITKYIKNRKILVSLPLIAIIAIAFFFRLWHLDSVPPGLYPDVAINGNDALDSLKTGNFKVFYPENNGREGLFMWLIAFSFSIFGPSVWAIKIVAAVIGILTVLGLYLLTKEIFSPELPADKTANQPQIIALLSSFFLAISFWHVLFSRLGFRAIMVPFILVFAFYFLFKGFREKKISSFAIGGIFFGLGFYTYTVFRLAVILLLFTLAYWFLVYRSQNLNKKFLVFASCFLIFTFFVALPIGIYFLQHPGDFVGRAAGVSIFSQPNPAKAFLKSLIVHMGMFNVYGDANWRHNLATFPMLFWPVGILFLTGFFISLKDFFRGLKEKNIRKLQAPGFALCLFFIMLLASVLTYEGIPHALRTIGVIPAVYIFVGLGAWRIYQWLQNNTGNKKLLLTACFIFLAMVAIAEFNKYFVSWAKDPNVQGAFSTDLAGIGDYLNSLPDNVQKYVVVNLSGTPVPYPNGIPMPSQTPLFIERIKYGESRTTYLLPEDLNKVKINKSSTVIIPLKPDQDVLISLLKNFKSGELQKRNSIYLYKINP